MATEEKLIPVRSESELRIGMRIVVKDCVDRLADGTPTSKPRTCQGILLKKIVSNEWGWTGSKYRLRVDKSIPEGRLFRVEDGLDEKADERQRLLDEAVIYAKKLERTK